MEFVFRAGRLQGDKTMTRWTVGLAVVVVLLGVGEVQAAIQWPLQDGGNGHYYGLSTQAVFWTDAEAYAASMGGHLASITSQAEQEFINATFLSGDNWDQTLWIGLSEQRQEGLWEWSTGGPFAFSNWDAGEPNDWFGDEDYVIINWDHQNKRGGWNDYGKWGTETAYGIIEWESEPIGTVEATLTSDNHYGLYHGGSDGTGLVLVGRNELGPYGDPGRYNWSLPETYVFDAMPDEYIYVLVWDTESDVSSVMWIGDFTFSNGMRLSSNLEDWEYAIGGENPGEYGELPSLETVQADIAGATWLTPLASAANGTIAPWGLISGISPSVDFIWHDTLSGVSSSGDKYVIFRAPNPIPEPSAFIIWSLLGTLGMSVGWWRRRHKV